MLVDYSWDIIVVRGVDYSSKTLLNYTYSFPYMCRHNGNDHDRFCASTMNYMEREREKRERDLVTFKISVDFNKLLLNN